MKNRSKSKLTVMVAALLLSSIACGLLDLGREVGFGVGAFEPTVSGVVWLDKNGNGIQDDGGEGVVGVGINLYLSDLSLIDSTLTKSNGSYELTGSADGKDYVITVDLPPGYKFSPQEQGSNRDLDSDIHPPSTQTDILEVKSEGLGILEDADAGLILLPTPTATNTFAVQPRATETPAPTSALFIKDLDFELTISSTSADGVTSYEISVSDNVSPAVFRYVWSLILPNGDDCKENSKPLSVDGSEPWNASWDHPDCSHALGEQIQVTISNDEGETLTLAGPAVGRGVIRQ